MSKEAIHSVQDIPSFTPEETLKIKKQLNSGRWREVGHSIDINDEWKIMITREERDWFNTGKASISDMAQFLIQTWKVYVYWWLGDEHEWTGFQIIPMNEEQENPYDTLMNPLDSVIDKTMIDIRVRIEQIKDSITELEKEKISLEWVQKDTQKKIWAIPNRVIDWVNIQSMIDDFKIQ